MEDKPPVLSKQRCEVVCGVPTQVVCTAFSSHILVVVTQFGKMGTLVALEPSCVAADINRPLITTKVLLGPDEVRWSLEGSPLPCSLYRPGPLSHPTNCRAAGSAMGTFPSR